jgi:hypothetical protein
MQLSLKNGSTSALKSTVFPAGKSFTGIVAAKPVNGMVTTIAGIK